MGSGHPPAKPGPRRYSPPASVPTSLTGAEVRAGAPSVLFLAPRGVLLSGCLRSDYLPFGPRGSTVSGRHLYTPVPAGASSHASVGAVRLTVTFTSSLAFNIRSSRSLVSIVLMHSPADGWAVRSLNVMACGSLAECPRHNTHAHSAEADVATASRQQSVVTRMQGERRIIGG